ncbi:hypothetical protein AAC387_Pa09g0424 [Persea americana]
MPSRGTCLLGQGGPHTRHIQKGESISERERDGCDCVVSTLPFGFRPLIFASRASAAPPALPLRLSLSKIPVRRRSLSLSLREALDAVTIFGSSSILVIG